MCDAIKAKTKYLKKIYQVEGSRLSFDTIESLLTWAKQHVNAEPKMILSWRVTILLAKIQNFKITKDTEYGGEATLSFVPATQQLTFRYKSLVIIEERIPCNSKHIWIKK